MHIFDMVAARIDVDQLENYHLWEGPFLTTHIWRTTPEFESHVDWIFKYTCNNKINKKINY